MTKRPADLQEPMPMPDPYFPIKVHHTIFDAYGQVTFNSHWHQHFEMHYVIAGEASVDINSKRWELRPGDIAVINCNDLHSGICLSERLEYYALIADLTLLHSSTTDPVDAKFILPLLHNRIVFRNKVADREDIGREVTAIHRELKDRTLGYELAVKSGLYRIVALLMRGELDREQPEDYYRSRMKNLERFTPVIQHIEAHYREPITVEKLSDHAGLSRFHFSRQFKELTGRTLMEYVNGVRLNRAEYLLRNTGMSVSEIAFECGFKDIYYFSRLFKRMRDVNPSDVRKKALSDAVPT